MILSTVVETRHDARSFSSVRSQTPSSGAASEPYSITEVQLKGNIITRAFALLLVAITLTIALSLPANAANARALAQQALRSKILREAGDRYDVRFLSVSVARGRGPVREVTGTGRFRRRGKSPQRFSFYTLVNVRNRRDHDTRYTIE